MKKTPVSEEDKKLSAEEFAEKHAGKRIEWKGYERTITGYHPNFVGGGPHVLLSSAGRESCAEHGWIGAGGLEPRHGSVAKWPRDADSLFILEEDFAHLLSVPENV